MQHSQDMMVGNKVRASWCAIGRIATLSIICCSRTKTTSTTSVLGWSRYGCGSHSRAATDKGWR